MDQLTIEGNGICVHVIFVSPISLEGILIN
jgi:hypothetical protein